MLLRILFVYRDLKDFDLSDITDEGNGVVERVLKDLSKVKFLDDFFCKHNI